MIKPIDLLSLNSNLRKLQNQIFKLTSKTNDLFLDINSSGARNYHKILKKLYRKKSVVSLSDFCKLYFSTEDDLLGSWKSNISIKIEELLGKNIEYDVDKSLLICKIIIRYKEYISLIKNKNEKNILKGADLAFMYIMFKYNLNEEDSRNLINLINNKYYYDVPEKSKKSKLIDLYKSNTIHEKITESVKEYKKKGKKSNVSI